MKLLGPQPAWVRICRTRLAFTLIEMLAAMAVFSLLMVMIFQAILLSSKVVGESEKKADAVAELRWSLDRIGIDLSARPARDDLPYRFEQLPGNDQMDFFSEMTAYIPGSAPGQPRSVSLISYRIDVSGASPPRLMRAASYLFWDAAPTLGFVPSVSAPLNPPSSIPLDPLAGSVFRMEISFLEKGTGRLLASAPPGPAALRQSIQGMFVTLAAFDQRTRLALGSPQAQLTALAAEFPDAQDGNDVFREWSDRLTALDALNSATSIAVVHLGGIRLLQRYYDLP